MKASVDAEACVLTGYCASVAPEVFDVSYGDATSAQVIVDEITDPELAERVRGAVASCPVNAIVADE